MIPAIGLAAVLATTPARTIDLVTVGEGDELYSAFGHTLVCARDAAAKPEARSGRCWDYGVADAPDAFSVMWSSIRGRPAFTTIEVPEATALGFFEGQGRRIERQTLPLSAAETDALVARLEADVSTHFAYAYHPYFANCSTQLRDRIDAATGGRLRAGVEGRKDSFRMLMEQGLSGRLFQLGGIALFLGEPNERVPDAWERMFLPEALRDGVTVRFDAPPEQIAEHVAVVLPTSTSVGRLGLLVLGLALAGIVRFAARRGRPRVGVALVGVVLGALGLAAATLALASTWPELSRNPNLLALWPTDLFLAWLPFTWRRRYARVRIASCALLALLEITSIVSQPVLTTAALVLLPMLAVARLAAPRGAAVAAPQAAAQPESSARAA